MDTHASTGRPGSHALVDEALPVAPHLLGDGARELLSAGVAATGGRLVDAQLAQVLYQPGRSITVRYEATVRWHGGDDTSETLLAGADRSGAPAGTLPMRSGDLEAGLWRYPFDPVLTGLADAVTGTTLQELVGAHTGSVHDVTVRSYRPGRRAVVRAAGPRGAVFVKVLEPGGTTVDLAARHDRAGRELPVPEVLAVDAARGLIVLAALPGESLRSELRRGGVPRPDAAALDDLAARFARVACGDEPSARTPPLSGATAHARLLRTVIPSARPALDEILERLDAAPAAARRRRTIHGDLHDGQLFVEGGRIVGVLDLDDVGLGDPLDDRANFLGHVSTLGVEDADGGDPAAARSTVDYAFALWRSGRHNDGDAVSRQLALRAAAVVLGLATGPFRVQQRDWRRRTHARLDLAKRWLDLGDRARAG